jgi:hypothetical protein
MPRFASGAQGADRACRSGGAFHFSGRAPPSGAGDTDNAIAALTDAAGAATTHAGVFDDGWCAVVMNRKSLSESHFQDPLLSPLRSGLDIIDVALRPRGEIA